MWACILFGRYWDLFAFEGEDQARLWIVTVWKAELYL